MDSKQVYLKSEVLDLLRAARNELCGCDSKLITLGHTEFCRGWKGGLNRAIHFVHGPGYTGWYCEHHPGNCPGPTSCGREKADK